MPVRRKKGEKFAHEWGIPKVYTDNAGNLTAYNAGVNQQMSTTPQYGSILLNNSNNALPVVVKTFVPTNPNCRAFVVQ